MNIHTKVAVMKELTMPSPRGCGAVEDMTRALCLPRFLHKARLTTKPEFKRDHLKDPKTRTIVCIDELTCFREHIVL